MRSFPAMLDGAPFLMPGEDVAVRPRLEHWFEAQRLHPRIIGEFDDSALLKAFGQAGNGLFVAPTAIAAYVCDQYRVTSPGAHRFDRRTDLRDYHRAPADPPGDCRHQSGAQRGLRRRGAQHAGRRRRPSPGTDGRGSQRARRRPNQTAQETPPVTQPGRTRATKPRKSPGYAALPACWPDACLTENGRGR
jgi:hypothetical protein